MEKTYYFYDTDPTGCADYDIAKEDFVELIELCCRYCNTLSFLIWEADVKVAEKLEPYRNLKPEAITYSYGEICGVSLLEKTRVHPEARYYRVCPELCALLPKIADHIFQWLNKWGYYNNPEDPVFYRSDGSVFFSSTIHEGECT